MALETTLQSLTEKVWIPKLRNGIFNGTPLLARLNRPDFKQLKDGGTQIVAPVIHDQAGEGAYYSGGDTHSINSTDPITNSRHEWRMLYEAIRITNEDLLKNNGPAAKLSLMKSRFKAARFAMKRRLTLGLVSDGGASTGANDTQQIDGLRAIINATSLYGAISVTEFSNWAAKIDANNGTARPLSLPLIQKRLGDLTEEDDGPTLMLMPQLVYDEAWALYQPTQRLIKSEAMAKLGFKALELNGVPFLVDKQIEETGVIYFLNEEYLYLCVHRKRDITEQIIDKLPADDTFLAKFYWMGNLICDNRWRQGKIEDIETA